MARLEEKIAEIKDPELRGAIADEVKALKAQKQFGLVFEQHQPEVVRVYLTDLNTWEQATIQAEINRDEVLGWVRNYERKPWALALPYEDGATVLPMYPDFLVVRQEGGSLTVDILEPHSSALADSWKKAKGLAKYAKMHSMKPGLGRIELLRKNGSQMQRLSLNDPAIQRKVLNWVTSNEHLDQMFDELA